MNEKLEMYKDLDSFHPNPFYIYFSHWQVILRIKKDVWVVLDTSFEFEMLNVFRFSI